jgi:hypothetical protein
MVEFSDATNIMSAALVSTQDRLDKRTALTNDPGASEAPDIPPPDALAPENQPPLRAAESPSVDSPGSGSSQSFGTTVVPNADEAIMSAASVSMQDRQKRLTALLHHLTVDPGAPDQDLPMAGPLPALRVEEPPQVDASVGFSGDRAMPGLQRQLARNPNIVQPAEGARGGWLFARLFVIAGVAAALVGWGIVLLPSARRAGNETIQAEIPPVPVTANVQSATGVPPFITDSPARENTEPPAAANVQSATGVPLPIHDRSAPESTEPPVAANVRSATGVPLPIHDGSVPESTEPPAAANVRSATGVPLPIHDGSVPESTEPPVAANVQSATGMPPPMHDGPAQENTPPLRAAEAPPVQEQKGGLSQSVGGPLVLDADEITALVKRGKDFVTNGDLVSARLLLRRAAEAGSAEAALALGETFDPLVFQRLHVIGIEPDAASAQKWYQRAAELGSAAASQHLAKPDRAP